MTDTKTHQYHEHPTSREDYPEWLRTILGQMGMTYWQLGNAIGARVRPAGKTSYKCPTVEQWARGRRYPGEVTRRAVERVYREWLQNESHNEQKKSEDHE